MDQPRHRHRTPLLWSQCSRYLLRQLFILELRLLFVFVQAWCGRWSRRRTQIRLRCPLSLPIWLLPLPM
ncbi:hypothetical protein CPB83DRAFT_857953 [Crepidotus variabilis]|uniref:Uncharacterized protein n=1 Tax=Crepidotus variabilis TaxID=179855 RepID=A0A9P6EC64_9AGAR|nr:hypothetical protein CPB83DRAFT_857953 [Crepidotus variabilis]